MRMNTTCVLISFKPDAHEVGTDPTDRRRTVKVQELSLNQTDRIEAGGEGLTQQAKLLIPYDRDYEGERELEYNGERWIVLDADPYKDWNGVILRIRRKDGNARSAPAIRKDSVSRRRLFGGITIIIRGRIYVFFFDKADIICDICPQHIYIITIL